MSNYSTLDRYDGLGNPLTPPDTYPAGWIIIAAVLAVIALWLPGMVLVVFAAIFLGVRAIWKEVRGRD